MDIFTAWNKKDFENFIVNVTNLIDSGSSFRVCKLSELVNGTPPLVSCGCNAEHSEGEPWSLDDEDCTSSVISSISNPIDFLFKKMKKEKDKVQRIIKNEKKYDLVKKKSVEGKAATSVHTALFT